jgi:hypothetical protein
MTLHPGISEDQQEVLALVGLALLTAQAAEALLRTCTTFVLPESPLTSIEQLDLSYARENKKTLGYFLAKLRERTDLYPDFDAKLQRYLEDRNMLVHKLKKLPGYDLSTKDGRASVSAFLMRFVKDSEEITMHLLGLIRAWCLDLGIPVPASFPSSMIERIDDAYLPLVEQVFGIGAAAKPSPAT